MANTVKKQAYHHGDLESALVETGMRLLEERGDGSIGLREVARATGVSPTAVYRHFPDKDALLAAIAAQGFERLADVQMEAAADHRDKAKAFRAIGQAYVRFALDNPALFRLMTSHMHLTGQPEFDGKHDNRAARLLRGKIDELLPVSASEADRKVAAVQAWALVHGLAMLVLGGQIPDDPALINAAVDSFSPGG